MRAPEETAQLYIVFICPDCGNPRYAEVSQKTALCFGCGRQIHLDPHKIRILFRGKGRQEAAEALRRYKMRRGVGSGQPRFQ